ncbi:MAG: TonB-dependent siderophore receptor [Puniceicoccaceae bacterium]
MAIAVPYGMYAQSSTGNNDDDVIELSPFEVNTTDDRGYLASTQVTGTRLNMPIRDLPFFLSVVTEELLIDTAAQSLSESVRFIPGVQPRPTANYHDTGFFMRGQQVNFIYRNGLRLYRTPSTDNIERVEVLKGPASVLFGESSPGGAINFIAKKARFANNASLQLQLGDFNRMKGVVDVNSVVRDDKLAIRMVGSYEQGDSFTDYEENTRWMFAPSLVYRPFDGTKIEISYEVYDIKRDGVLWNGHYAWRGPDNLGGTAPDGSTNAITEVHPSVKLSDNPFPNGFYDSQNHVFIASWEQELTDWLINRFAYAYADGDNESAGSPVNDRPLVVGSPGDDNYIFDPDTFNLIVARKSANRNTDWLLRDELVATYEGLGGTHTVLLGYESVEAVFQRKRMTQNNKYRDNDNPYAIAWNAKTKEHYGMAEPGAINLRNEEMFADIHQRGDRTGVYFNLQSRMVDDRLVMMGGLRRHNYKRYNLLNDPGNRYDGKTSDTTPQVGASFEITPDVSVFGSYSESYLPQIGLDAAGNAFDPLAGEGYEAGVKVELMDGKLVGTVSYFDSTLGGLLRFDWNFVRPDGGTGGVFSSGKEQSTGVDFDLVYSPIPNWQTVIGLTLLDTEVVSNAQTPAIVGLPTINAADQYFTLWSKYSFTEGGMDGFWIAGGLSYTGGDRITRYNWAFKNGSYTLVDLAAGYKFSAGEMPMELQVNLKNLTDERYFVHESMPGRPLEWQVTLRMEF